MGRTEGARDDDSEDEQMECSCHTVFVRSPMPFQVFHDKKQDRGELLACITRELGDDVTFARFLLKYL